MGALHYILLSIALVSIAQAATVSRKRHPHSDATFYYLVRQWPETFCKTHGCSKQPQSDRWTIHGLWPNYDKGGYPTNCPGVPLFDKRDISNLGQQLRAWWPSYKGKDEDFWKHEYNTHGTCEISDLDEEAYFAATLELNDRYPIEAALEAAGIVPDEDRTYATSDIEDALAAAWGAKPEVMCACTHGGWRQECQEALIDSILICIDASLKIGPCNYKCTGEEGCEHTNCDRVQYRPL